MKKIACLFLILVIVMLSKDSHAIEYTGQSLRDPFSSTKMGGSSIKDEIATLSFTLEGFVWNTKRPQAIINGQVVEVGSKIENAEILDIQKGGVKMRYKGKEFFLRPKKTEAEKSKS